MGNSEADTVPLQEKQDECCEQQNRWCQNKCSWTNCRMKALAIISMFVAVVSLIFVWIGTEFMVNSRSEGTVWGLILVPCAALALGPNILICISVRMQNANRAITVLAICFSAIYILCDLAIGGVFLGVAGDLRNYSYAFNSNSIQAKQFKGAIIIALGSYIMLLSQIICIIVASYETKRVVSPRTITTQKIVIATDPMTGQQFSQVIQENIPQAELPTIIRSAAYLPSRRNKIGAVFSFIITTIGVILMLTGSSIADHASKYGIGLWLFIIFSFILIWIYISNIFLLISVCRTNTHHGFSVTALVFAILTALGAFGIIISFALISVSSQPHTYTYTYSGYYNSYYGDYVSPRTHSTTYGSYGEKNGYGVVSFSGVMIMAGQILAIIFSAFEIKRAPPSLRNATIMVPMTSVYSPLGTNSPQPQVFYNPPQIYPYPMEVMPPVYAQRTNTV